MSRATRECPECGAEMPVGDIRSVNRYIDHLEAHVDADTCDERARFEIDALIAPADRAHSSVIFDTLDRFSEFDVRRVKRTDTPSIAALDDYYTAQIAPAADTPDPDTGTGTDTDPDATDADTDPEPEPEPEPDQ